MSDCIFADMKVAIVSYNASWPGMFGNEKQKINDLIGFLNPDIEHIGSTSIPGLCAKPIIDIAVGLPYFDDLDKTIQPMQQHYTYVKLYEPDWPTRRFYCKYLSEEHKTIPTIINVGELSGGEQGFTSLGNIHIFIKDSEDWVRHIALRDYLRTHDDERDACCELKKELSKMEFSNMISYNDAKNDFVKDIQLKAVKWYTSKE